MVQLGLSAATLLSNSGCVLRPEGAAAEHSKLTAAAVSYETTAAPRRLPELPVTVEWRDALSRAFLANGELEAAYFEWKAALQRIDQAATWPNSNVAVTFSYLFSAENLKAWDRTTLGVGFDPSMNLTLPVKARKAGQVALDAAREAAERFRAVKFDLQRRVLSAYLDLSMTEDLIRIERDNQILLELVKDSARDRAQAGGPLQDLSKAMIESQLSGNEGAALQTKAQSLRGVLNGMLGRDANAALTLPASLPAPREVQADDAELISAGVAQNPELAALAQQVAGRADAIEVARLQYLPDLAPSASITGSLSQTLGSMVMLPTKVPAIRAGIEEAQAMARASEAMLRQRHQDRAASFVANLCAMRNAERQVQLYRERVLPAAQQLINSSRSAYAAGTIGFADLVDSERMLLTVRRMLVESQIEREQRLADLEALAGVDIETLGVQAAARAQSVSGARP
ncbi:MAG TPA: TolC family protein [Steroidobacteraceae bacterium]